MDWQHDEQVRVYRDTLLASLRARTIRARAERPEVFQVFVNQESIGILDGRRDETSRISCSRERAIHSVEIRSESGDLVGGVCLQEFDRKTARFRIGRSTLEVDAQNRPDGSTMRVALQASSPAWSRMPDLLSAALARLGASVALIRAPLWAAVQVGLVLAVFLLLADRFGDRWEAHDARVQALSSTTKPVEARLENKLQETQLALARQEQLLGQLTQAQEETVQKIKAQQQALAGLHRAVETVAQSRMQQGTGVKTAQSAAGPKSDRTVQAIEDQVNKVLRSMESDRERMFNHIFHMADTQERITREQAKLHDEIASLKKREMQTSLEQQAVTVAKMMLAQEAGKGAPGTETPSDTTAKQKQEPKAYLVTFWVSFQDGTSEESIEQLIKDIHGRKGPGNAGWYPVEVNLPKPQASDELLESLKKAKIVKSITTSLNTAPAPK